MSRCKLITQSALQHLYEYADQCKCNKIYYITTLYICLSAKMCDMENEKTVKKGRRNRKRRDTRLEKLSQAIYLSGMTQEEIADQIPISRQNFGRWFKLDDIKLSNLEKIAEIIGCELKWDIIPKKEE